MNEQSFTINAPLAQRSDGTIHVTGSRVTLDTLVRAFINGASAEQIHDSFPSVSLRDIYGVIAWYLDHETEVGEYLKRRQQEASEIRQKIEARQDSSVLRERLQARRSQLVSS